MFRDSFPQLVKLTYKAINLVSNLNEDDKFNPLAGASRDGDSINRIFGSAPGSYGAGLQELISNSNWENIDDFGAVSYTHLRAHETRHDLVCRLLLEKKKRKTT